MLTLDKNSIMYLFIDQFSDLSSQPTVCEVFWKAMKGIALVLILGALLAIPVVALTSVILVISSIFGLMQIGDAVIAISAASLVSLVIFLGLVYVPKGIKWLNRKYFSKKEEKVVVDSGPTWAGALYARVKEKTCFMVKLTDKDSVDVNNW